MTNLQIPFALDLKGNLIEPCAVKKNGEYYCPICYESVFFRSGGNKCFFHKHVSQCGSDEIFHQAAKLMIVKAIVERNFDATKQIQIRGKCCVCNDDCLGILTDKFNVAKLDVQVDSNYVADICLFKNGAPSLVVELISSFRAGDETIKKIPTPFIRVNAKDVLKDHLNWFSISGNHLSCGCCKLL